MRREMKGRAVHADVSGDAVDATTEHGDAGDEREFQSAIDEYKRRSGRMFPTWSEVLQVAAGLGYHKPEDPPRSVRA